MAHVINATTIELAESASLTVAGVEVILNRGDRVALDDYARRTVANLTLDFGDRTINDAAMKIGGRALISETAGFSSLDLGKPVTIREAGLLVTTVQSFDSSTQVTLAAPAQRAVAEGMADVWKTDSRPGLEQLLATLDSLDVESVEIRFGPGVYDFTRIPDATHPMNAAIGLQGMKNLTIRGAGPGVTILRLMPQQDLSGPDTHVIETRDCTRAAVAQKFLILDSAEKPGDKEGAKLAAGAGQHLLRMLDLQPLSSDYRDAFIRYYPFPALTPEQRATLDSESLNFFESVISG